MTTTRVRHRTWFFQCISHNANDLALINSLLNILGCVTSALRPTPTSNPSIFMIEGIFTLRDAKTVTTLSKIFNKANCHSYFHPVPVPDKRRFVEYITSPFSPTSIPPVVFS